MDDGPLDPETGELTPRDPSLEDLVDLCRELNSRQVKYLIIGGFAIRVAGYPRTTGDVDLIVAADLENEARLYAALESLPDQASEGTRSRRPLKVYCGARGGRNSCRSHVQRLGN